MAVVKKDELADSFAKARTWDGERVRAEARSRKLAWVLAGTSSVLSLGAMLTLFGMFPLRTVETRVIRVNETTGFVELVTPVVGTQTYNEAVTKHWLWDYVRAREGFLFDEAPFAFRKVNLMSTEQEQARFTESYTVKNGKSFLATLGREGTAKIDIRSISFPSANLALVRFARTIRRGNGPETVTSYLATISYEYQTAPIAEGDIMFNPLGFTVKEYRIDAET
jgi:type IV secretion system protein VirB8